MQEETGSWRFLVGFGAGCAAAAILLLQTKRIKWISSDNKEKRKLGPLYAPDSRFELKLVGERDGLYDEEEGPRPFEFNEEVVQVFDDMVSRSVPLYAEVIDLLLYWVHRYYVEGTWIVDLGCSTGTTLDVLGRSLKGKEAQFLGIDNSSAMVLECTKKLKWMKGKFHVHIEEGDILNFAIDDHESSIVIMNYTLQFVPVMRRLEVLTRICASLCDGGVLYLSEKIRADDAEVQECITWIYEDFKARRGYSQRYIARKKEALMNVLVPYTEDEMKAAFYAAGFSQVEIVAKWNNFTTFAARKNGRALKKNASRLSVDASGLENLFESNPVHLAEFLTIPELHKLCKARVDDFANKGTSSADTIERLDTTARKVLQTLPQGLGFKVENGVLCIGNHRALQESQREVLHEALEELKPWKKGPLKLFDTFINTEWRSDWKWERIAPHLPSLENAVICDIGCGNGYYMFNMLEKNPKLVIGVDPNLRAWTEFQLLKKLSGASNIHLEFLRGSSITLFPQMFDVVFCLGVLYHVSDPVGMLRDMHSVLKNGATLVVDCMGIAGEEPIALFPKKRYANMTGVYFLPTLNTLLHWMTRAQFRDLEVIFNEPLSTEEQRITEWAPVNTSLKESLNESKTATVEGYAAPSRFYVLGTR